jgi:hypothetical protein
MPQAPLTLRRWTRVEYERLVDLGAFDREPVELVGGQMIVAEPQATYHVTTVGTIGDRLGAVLVADSSLAFDREQKGSLALPAVQLAVAELLA